RYGRALDRHVVERRKLDLGIALEGRTELEVVIGLRRLGLEARIARHAQVLLLDRFAEGLLQRIAQYFLAHLPTILLLHQPERHLAGPEAVHAHVARDALQA